MLDAVVTSAYLMDVYRFNSNGGALTRASDACVNVKTRHARKFLKKNLHTVERGRAAVILTSRQEQKGPRKSP